jgi:hypothetical protein
MILDGMKYLNEFWSGARAWALYVKFGADLLAVQYLCCSTTLGRPFLKNTKYAISTFLIYDS